MVPAPGDEPLGPTANVVFGYGYGADVEPNGIGLVTPVARLDDGPAVPPVGMTGILEFGSGKGGKLEIVLPPEVDSLVPEDTPLLVGQLGTLVLVKPKGGWLEDNGGEVEIPVPELERPGTVPVDPAGRVVLGNGNGASLESGLELEDPVPKGPEENPGNELGRPVPEDGFPGTDVPIEPVATGAVLELKVGNGGKLDEGPDEAVIPVDSPGTPVGPPVGPAVELEFDKENGGLIEEYVGYPVPDDGTGWVATPDLPVGSDVKVELGKGNGGRLVELPVEGEINPVPDEGVPPVDNPDTVDGPVMELAFVKEKGGSVEEPMPVVAPVPNEGVTPLDNPEPVGVLDVEFGCGYGGKLEKEPEELEGEGPGVATELVGTVEKLPVPTLLGLVTEPKGTEELPVGKGGRELVAGLPDIPGLVGPVGFVPDDPGLRDEADVFVSGYGTDDVPKVEDGSPNDPVPVDDAVVTISVPDIDAVIFVSGITIDVSLVMPLEGVGVREESVVTGGAVPGDELPVTAPVTDVVPFGRGKGTEDDNAGKLVGTSGLVELRVREPLNEGAVELVVNPEVGAGVEEPVPDPGTVPLVGPTVLFERGYGTDDDPNSEVGTEKPEVPVPTRLDEPDDRGVPVDQNVDKDEAPVDNPTFEDIGPGPLLAILVLPPNSVEFGKGNGIVTLVPNKDDVGPVPDMKDVAVPSEMDSVDEVGNNNELVLVLDEAEGPEPAEPGRLELELPDGNGGRVDSVVTKLLTDPDSEGVTEPGDDEVRFANGDVGEEAPDVEMLDTFTYADDRPDVVAEGDGPGLKELFVKGYVVGRGTEVVEFDKPVKDVDVADAGPSAPVVEDVALDPDDTVVEDCKATVLVSVVVLAYGTLLTGLLNTGEEVSSE
ncbi:hypothetical protein B0T21DRAFT_414150 [Apiosordaria backusii]|uniref:Uncharacterized protein n=1 Tax=Apiosordaria backusii TaxID=314023 RepID=A0AA40AXL3_9PEZI|nr:hypothetical protein B0T21DRAFT_414150 [Apiosordaria backusii]